LLRPLVGSLFLPFLEPQERTDAPLSLELHLQTAAGHDSRIAPPAGFMIQIDAVHVKAGTDLLDLPFITRQLFTKHLQKIHKHPIEIEISCYIPHFAMTRSVYKPGLRILAFRQKGLRKVFSMMMAMAIRLDGHGRITTILGGILTRMLQMPTQFKTVAFLGRLIWAFGPIAPLSPLCRNPLPYSSLPADWRRWDLECG